MYCRFKFFIIFYSMQMPFWHPKRLLNILTGIYSILEEKSSNVPKKLYSNRQDLRPPPRRSEPRSAHTSRSRSPHVTAMGSGRCSRAGAAKQTTDRVYTCVYAYVTVCVCVCFRAQVQVDRRGVVVVGHAARRAAFSRPALPTSL